MYEEGGRFFPKCQESACRFQHDASATLRKGRLGGSMGLHDPGPRNIAAAAELAREAGPLIEGPRARRARAACTTVCGLAEAGSWGQRAAALILTIGGRRPRTLRCFPP